MDQGFVNEDGGNPMVTVIHHKNATLVKHFLLGGYQDQLDVLDTCVAEVVTCHNFPEFNPTSREEFKAFFRYMADAINQLQFTIEHLTADEQTVKVYFHIHGVHHEEFMGFPASGKHIDFRGSAVYRIEQDKIVEAWMHTNEVVFSNTESMARQIGDAQFALFPVAYC